MWSSLRHLVPLACIAVIAMCSDVRAQYSTDEVPAAIADLGVDPKIGDALPLELRFIDSENRHVQLADFVDGSKPVFVTLNYSNCPGLCVAQLNNLVKAVNDLHDMRLGRDFLLLSISIDPTETKERLAGTKERYSYMLADKHDVSGWHFLRGDRRSIAAVAAATGFRYSYDPVTKQYNHAAVAIGVSPEGVITRYLYDLALSTATLRLALVETSAGKLGSIGDQVLLWCYHFDPDENKYSASAMRLMSIGGGVFVAMLLAVLAPFWFIRRPPNGIEDTDSAASGPADLPESSPSSL